METTTLWPLQFDWEKATPDEASGDALQERLTRELLARSPDDTPPEKLVAFGRYIQALRRKKGVSRRAVAQKGGIDPLALALLEGGILREEEVSEILVARVALGLGIRRVELAIDPLREPRSVNLSADGQPTSLIDWLKQVLALLTASRPLAAQPLGNAPPPAAATVVSLPLALPLVEVPDGERTLMLAMTMHDAPQGSAGQADLHVQVSDESGTPQAGVGIVLVTRDRDWRAETPTDRDGKTRIAGIDPLSLKGETMRFALGESELDRTIRLREAALAKIPQANPHRQPLIHDLITDYARRIDLVGDEGDLQRRDALAKEI